MMDENKNSIPQALSDEEVSTVSGGTSMPNPAYTSDKPVTHIYQVGDVVFVKCFGHGTVRCRVTAVGSDYNLTTDDKGNAVKEYVDTYLCQKLDSALFFINGWKDRDQIVGKE